MMHVTHMTATSYILLHCRTHTHKAYIYKEKFFLMFYDLILGLFNLLYIKKIIEF